MLCSKALIQKRKQSDMSNYRPISLITSFSKIFEKLIYARIYQHLVGSNILADEQYGFRINSTVKATTHKLLNVILNAINKKKIVDGIFCYLHMALTVLITKYCLLNWNFMVLLVSSLI